MLKLKRFLWSKNPSEVDGVIPFVITWSATWIQLQVLSDSSASASLKENHETDVLILVVVELFLLKTSKGAGFIVCFKV